MRKISSIKLIFAALSVVVIVLLLYLHFSQSCKSYKSLAIWGQMGMGYSEQAYYTNKLRNIITEWQRAGKRIDTNKNNTYLLIDLAKNAIWLEENGHVKNDYYFEFPKQNSWILNYSSPQKSIELPKRTILYIKEKEQQLTGQFYLYGVITKKTYYCSFDTITCSMDIPFPLSIRRIGPEFTNAQDYTSLIVSEEEYKKYKGSLAQTNPEQFDENETFRQKILEDHILKWLEIENYLHMEIVGQIQNAGYELRSLELRAGPDYTAANAIIEAHGESILNKYLNTDWGNKTVRAYFKIDYLGDGIWYAKTSPNPKLKLQSNKKFDLEFLIFPFEQIPRLQYKKYTKEGRKAQQPESFISSKWKITLPNNLIVKILGIRDTNNPDIWWGPDGKRFNSPLYFINKIPDTNETEKNLQIVWQIKWPENKTGGQPFFNPEGAKSTYGGNITDRYGNEEGVMISFYDTSNQKADLKVGIK
jgi:hypothetical protein